MSFFLTRRAAKFFMVVLSTALVCSCANNEKTNLPVDLQMVKKSRKDSGGGIFNVTELLDNRLNKAMGISQGKSVDSINDPMSWVRESLQNRGYRITGPGNLREEEEACDLALELNILDFQTSSTSKSTNVVLTLKNKTFPAGKIIRGQFTGTMWGTSDKEVASAIRKSLSRAIDNLDDAMQISCPGDS